MTFSSEAGRTLKILHIGKYFAPFSGGLENYQYDAMNALAARGIQSAALVHQHELSLTTRQTRLEAHGMQLPVVKTATWAKVLFTPISPGFVWHLSQLIKSFKPEILHLHMPNPSAFWALFLPAARRIPWVVHWHADVITEQQGWGMKFVYQIYRHFERAILKRADSIITTSPPYLASSLPLQPWKTKCRVVPLGVDQNRIFKAVKTDEPGSDSANDLDFDPVTDVTENRTENEKIGDVQNTNPPLQVLAIGRLTYYKGFSFLIEAAALAPHVHVHLVGGGEEEQSLKALTTSLNLQERVTFHGHLSAGELRQRFGTCDCLCLPSIERTEAFGMVLLEAQCFGKATVISDVEGSGMGWVVDDQQTGLKVPPGDAQALATALLHMDSNRAELTAMGRHGRQKFETEFEISHAIEPLINLYQDVVMANSRHTTN